MGHRTIMETRTWRALALALAFSLAVPATVLAAAPLDSTPPGKPRLSPAAGGQRYVPGEVIVKYRSHVGPTAAAVVQSALGLSRKAVLPLGAGEVLRLPAGASVEETVDALRRRPEVEYAQPNYLYYPDAFLPNDPEFSNLWGLHNTGQTVNGRVGREDVDIDAPEAWDLTRGDGSVVVAVIDTGVDIDHPDLAGRIWTNPGESGGGKENNGVDDDGNGYVDDVHGWDFYNRDNTVFDPEQGDEHGTHVAGTIAAVANNRLGITGIADVKIMPLKFLGPDGGTTQDAINAIEYARRMGVRISNNSWGGGSYDAALYNAIRDSGMVFVAAAGNSSLDNDSQPHYPSSYNLQNIIAVAALDSTGALASFSNYGRTSVDVGAPGVDILSTYPNTLGAAISVTDATYGYRAVTWGFGLEEISDAVYRADAVSKILGGLFGLPTSAPILLVDDDEDKQIGGVTYDYRSYYENALRDAGYINFTTVGVVYGSDGPSSVTMAVYDAVVWFTGLACGTCASGGPFALTPGDQSNLIAYLETGGNLFLSGEDAALGAADSSLYRDYLRVRPYNEFGRYLSVRWTDQVAGAVYAGIAYALYGEDPDRDILHAIDAPARPAKVAMYYVGRTDYQDGYAYNMGTSMAAPHVTGVAALLMSRNPSATVTDVVNAILTTTAPLLSLQGKTATGGMVNAYGALQAIGTGGDGGGDGGGGGGGGAPLPPADEVTEEVGSAAKTITAFDGEVELDVPASTFAAGVKLAIKKVAEEAEPVLEGLRPLSAVFEFDAGGSRPQKPVTVAVRFDKAKLAGVDPRKLGLYRQSDQDPGRWDYVGGAVDPARGVVKARLKGFSRYAVMAYDRTFADLRGHWGRDEVEVLASRHLAEGVNEREFQPDRSITRAELAKLLVRMLAQDPDRGVTVSAPATPTFRDVPAGAWHYAFVETAERLGLVQGYGGRFRPDDPVTREEMTAMVLRAMGLQEAARAAANAALPFDDAEQVAGWARGYVAVAFQKGLVKGMGGGAFAPAGTATRAQGAAVVLRAMEWMGMITAPVTVTGTVTVSEIEGRHLELEVSSGSRVTRYVLVPADPAVGRMLEASVGRRVRVTGLVEDRPNIYMRGPLLRVLQVTAAD